jgi:hypothetical protein
MNPDGNPRIPGSSDEWMSHAKSDLRLAHMAAGDEFVLRVQAYFHIR